MAFLIDKILHDQPLSIFSLRVSKIDADKLFSMLSVAEQARANKFRKRQDFERFVAAHSLKRYLLSKYLELSPDNLEFDVGSYGKPFCCQASAPYFSISHSGDWVAIGISLRSEIGVDIEFPRDLDPYSILDRVCSVKQVRQFSVATTPEQMFLCFWTQKEAIAKACGQGISVGLPGIACSGVLGSEQLVFLQQKYHLKTLSWRDRGVLCVASMDSVPPDYWLIEEFDGGSMKLTYDGENAFHD